MKSSHDVEKVIFDPNQVLHVPDSKVENHFTDFKKIWLKLKLLLEHSLLLTATSHLEWFVDDQNKHIVNTGNIFQNIKEIKTTIMEKN